MNNLKKLQIRGISILMSSIKNLTKHITKSKEIQKALDGMVSYILHMHDRHTNAFIE